MKDYFNPVPKPPVTKKKKKKKNGNKDKPNRYCYYCGTSGAERHEVYGGNSNRQNSIDHGFQVDLCEECHREIEANITEQAQERNRYWEEYWQQEYERRLTEAGITKKQARDCWMALIGKNYLETLEGD